MRYFLCVILALLAAPAWAVPTLTGPLINAVTTDLQNYTPGQAAQVAVTLVNNTGGTFSGTVTGAITGRGRPAGTTASVQVITLPAGASQNINLTFTIPPNAASHGYLVAISATSAANVIDTAAAALDVSPDWAAYPRECFVTQFSPGTDTRTLVAGLNAWHCNVLQFYDVNYKHHQPYNSTSSWPNLANSVISRSTVESYIGNAHAKGMAAFDYTLWNGAFPNFISDGSNVSLSWGMFTSKCAPNCSVANLAGTPSNGGSGAQFPSNWAASWLSEMDPTNPGWIRYFETQTAQLTNNLGYDGVQIDTLGDPGTVYNSTGGVIDLSTALSNFYNAVRSSLNVRGVINSVSNWDEADVAKNAQEDFYYAEIHPEFNDTPYYPSINALTASIRSYTGKAINLPLYMDDNYSNSPNCISGGGSTPCYFNLPGLLYADAAMFAAGAYHVYLADGDRFISNIYVPGAQLLMSPAAIQAEFDYQTFGVAMEKLLRNGVSDSAQPAVITSGATGTSTGAAGTVYMLPKIRPGLQILHLLNFSQVPTIINQDTNANQPAPVQLGPIGVKMYYAGTLTGNNLLWFASPDVNHGAPQSLAYTKGTDQTGTFIQFTAPSLLYWDMVWLETDRLGTSDYATP